MALGLGMGAGTLTALSDDDQWVYATLQMFLLIASRNPYAHKSLIWFTVWSSVVHAAIMGVQALMDTAKQPLVWRCACTHSRCDVLGVLMPRTATLGVSAPQTAQA